MRFAKTILCAAVAVALALYSFDCSASASPEQSMQCCKSMRCSSHGHHHGQDCCKDMPVTHAAIGQPSSVQGSSFSAVDFGVVRDYNEFQTIESSAGMIAEHSHAPPICSLPTV